MTSPSEVVDHSNDHFNGDRPACESTTIEIDYSQIELYIFNKYIRGNSWYRRLWFWSKCKLLGKTWRRIY